MFGEKNFLKNLSKNSVNSFADDTLAQNNKKEFDRHLQG